ncbi:MAG TPA: L,D-transpeptidase, partial [Vicinamibacterales bacterium]|nr:L,D-transpeptidase [Vicinamibacterales bacterium]
MPMNGIYRLLRLAGIVAVLVAGAAPAVSAYPIDPNWSPPTTVYIPETGQSIDGLFLDLWRSGGGAMSYGNPITPEITEEKGKIVQYYQYARFEYWPEGDENGNYVTLGEIGRELGPPLLVRRFVNRATTAPGEELTVARAWQPLSDASATLMAIEQPSYRFVPETRHGVWGGFRAFWEATGEAAYLGNPLSEEYIADGISYQTFERGQLRWREGEDITMTPVGAMLTDRYDLSTDPQPQGAIPVYDEALFVPPVAIPALDAAPPAPGGGRAVVVSLGQQALWAYEDGVVVRSTYVSTGKEKFRTPTGLFTVNSKVPEQDMAGVIGGEAYNVPKVPDVLYFTNRGHAIHGTYWHENFGVPMSHGCINLPMDVAEWMYEWAPTGMAVLILE